MIDKSSDREYLIFQLNLIGLYFTDNNIDNILKIVNELVLNKIVSTVYGGIELILRLYRPAIDPSQSLEIFIKSIKSLPARFDKNPKLEGYRKKQLDRFKKSI